MEWHAHDRKRFQTTSWVQKTVQQGLPARLPPLDQRTMEKLKEQAMKKAKVFQQQVRVSTRENLRQARLVAADIKSSRSAVEAGDKVWRLVNQGASSAWMKAFSRLLICLYFVNHAYDSYWRWVATQQPDMKLRALKWPHHYMSPSFPWLSVAVVLPCALLTAAGVKVLVAGSALVVFEAYDSARLIWTQLVMLVVYGYKPNELMVKRLAMMGCAVLVLANSVKENKATNSYAGLLLSPSSGEPSRRKSLVLLLARVLLALLFVYVGVTQAQRVVSRDFALFARGPPPDLARPRDGHDNNWLLLELLLALPFVVGYRTAVCGLLLAATLCLEAFTCWPPWAPWPTWPYASHVRLHFVTNLSVAGGLLLLVTFGAGRYTVDAMLKPKKKE